MKNYYKIIFGLMLLCISLGLFSCTSGNKNSSNLNVYSITCKESDYYTFGGNVSCTSGNTANVKLTSKYDAYEITGCYYNGIPCIQGEDEDNAKVFTYIMPECNVEITVIGKWNDALTAGYQNFLSFDSTNTYTAEVVSQDEEYNNDQYWGTPLVLSFSTDVNYMTVATIDCISSNEVVLPTSAIAVNEKYASNSNSIVGGSIVIDRSKAKVGLTQIVLHVKNGNNNSYDDIIVVTVTFTQ